MSRHSPEGEQYRHCQYCTYLPIGTVGMLWHGSRNSSRPDIPLLSKWTVFSATSFKISLASKPFDFDQPSSLQNALASDAALALICRKSSDGPSVNATFIVISPRIAPLA